MVDQVAARPHPALARPRFSRRLRSHPPALRRHRRTPRRKGSPRLLLLQLRRGPLRALLGQRLREDRDAVPQRSLRHLPGMRGQTLPAAHARHQARGQIHPRRPRPDRRRSRRVLRRASDSKQGTRHGSPTRSMLLAKSASATSGSASRSTPSPAANPSASSSSASSWTRQPERPTDQSQLLILDEPTTGLHFDDIAHAR